MGAAEGGMSDSLNDLLEAAALPGAPCHGECEPLAVVWAAPVLNMVPR